MSHLSISQEIYTTITTALGETVTGVFDKVPSEQASPYIVIGQLQSLEGRLLDASERMWAVDVHIWSSYLGRKEIVEIADEIRNALPGKWFFEELVVLEDPSGWFHGVLTIRGYDR
jgi:hypothetical protein